MSRRQPPKNTQFKMRFVTVDATTAAEGRKKRAERSKEAVNAASLASDPLVNKLCLSAEQRAEIDAYYTSRDRVVDAMFEPSDQEHQTRANALLGAHGLDTEARELYENRWHTVFSKHLDASKEKKRVLLQCACGYHHTARGYKTRHGAFPFTLCPAHVEITYNTKTDKILRVRGILEHNSACKSAEICGIAAVPVHPEVYEVALRQLALGATYHEIMEQNRTLFRTKGGYASQPALLTASKYRWELQLGDSRSLYRQHHRLTGIAAHVQPHVNIDDWLNPESPKYDAELAAQVFHYQRKASAGERFEACLMTDRMKEAAWKYSHRSQMLLDGTFGVCDRKVLLFIAMGIDEEQHGVPLALFMFSAPSGNRQTSAGYDADVLTKLLSAWKTSLGTRNGASFEPFVIITDTDLRERNALLRVWPKAWLLLCKFHLRQAWRNHRNKALQGKRPALIRFKERFRRVEQSLVETTSYAAARDIIAHERATLENQRSAAPGPVQKALVHLDYLATYWLSEPLWKSWSQYGREYAANVLGRDVSGVLTTTNHLEAFNRVLKRKHLRRWQRNGRPLRLDVLLRVLATRILPAVFKQRDFDRLARAHIDEKILRLPGGKALLAARRDGKANLAPALVAFLQVDEERDAAARKIVEHGQISVPAINAQQTELAFVCYSTLALENESNPVRYDVLLQTSGLASCSCPDWQHRGGACKHLRAAMLRLDALRSDLARPHFAHLPCVSLPRTELEGRALQASLIASVDQSAGQAVGGAQHTAAVLEDELDIDNHELFDQGEPQRLDRHDESDSDSESVATDADSTAGISDGEFDIVEGHDSRAALDEQAVARVIYNLRGALPKIGDFTEFLSAVQAAPAGKVEELYRARDTVAALLAQLQRLTDVRADTAALALHAAESSGHTSSPIPAPARAPAPAPARAPAPASGPAPAHMPFISPHSPEYLAWCKEYAHIDPQLRPPPPQITAPITSPSPTVPTQTPHQPATSRKRPLSDVTNSTSSRPTLLPVSPERAQKRKKSYGFD